MKNSLQDKIINVLIDYRRLTVFCVAAVSTLLCLYIPGMKTDPTLKSGIDTSSAVYRTYERFLDSFGAEEFILVAVKGPARIDDPEMLKRLASMTEDLEKIDKIVQVVSLANLKVFQEREGIFGSYPLVERHNGNATLVGSATLESLRRSMPAFDLLLAPDLKTWGVLLRMDDRWKFDIPAIKSVVQQIDGIAARDLPPGSQLRVVGSAIIRMAIDKYNVRTAALFGVLCLLIATGVSFYIFKSFRVSVITLVVMIVCVSWILAFMSIAAIPLTSTTGLSFGLVLIVSVATVIRIVTHFNERYSRISDRVEAARQALQILFIPCLMCSVTTAVGFASIMVTTIPMVFQLGLIMSLGVLFSFLLCMILTPAFLILLPAPSRQTYDRMSRDWMAVTLDLLERTIFKHHRASVIVGGLFTATMLAGIPFIHSDTQIVRMLSDRTPEMKDIRFVEDNLANIHSVEIFLEADRNAFKKPENWTKVWNLEQHLRKMPEVVATDSFLSLMGYLAEVLKGPDCSAKDVCSDPRLISDLLAATSVSSDGQAMLRRFLDRGFGKMHITVWIRNSPDVPITETIEHLRDAAASSMGQVGTVTVTGDLAVFAAQAEVLVRSQLYSLVLAFFLITVLLMVHLKSWALGLVSLIPNVVPVAAILGAMGWLDISLDTVTVFCAAVSLGLAVDDTVHFLKHLRYELTSRGHEAPFSACVHKAFRITAKPMVSTSAVLFFGFIMLLISPFNPVNSFGILCSVAIVTALAGDVVLLPSILLSVPFLQRLIVKHAAPAGG